MKKGLVPAPAVGGSWRDGIWNLAIGIINFLLGNNQIVRGITQLAHHGYGLLRGVRAVPDEVQVDRPGQQEVNPVQSNNRDVRDPGAEGVVSRDETDGPIQPDNRGPNAAGGAMGDEPGTDQPDTSYHGSPETDSRNTTHIRSIRNTGSNNPIALLSRNSTVSYGQGSEQGGETQQELRSAVPSGAGRVEIDDIIVGGHNNPFMLSADNCTFKYKEN